MKLFLNTFPHVQVDIFFSFCHGVSNTGLTHFVKGFNTMKKFVSLINLIKSITVYVLYTLGIMWESFGN